MSVLRLILSIPRQIKAFIYRVSLGLKMAFSKKSYLVRTGYVHSRIFDSLKNKEGEFLPWMNYSIIKLFDERLSPDLKVFEYGSGSSTMYFARRVASITSVEYDQRWFDKVTTIVADESNVEVTFVPLDDQYHKAISNFTNEGPFDVVIIDGRKRVESAINSYPHLSQSGVIVLDDSARPHYQEAFDFYHGKGYQHLTFTGLKPTGFGMDQTTIFYKSGQNCLGL